MRKFNQKRWANMLQITFVENDRVEVHTPNKSSVIQRNQLKTSDHPVLQFHFPYPQTSCLPTDPSVSPLRNFPKSTPNCLPLINQFPDVVPSQCHDFPYPTGQFHCLFQCFPYPIPHLPKPHSCFILNASLWSRQSYLRNRSSWPWPYHKESYSPPRMIEVSSISCCMWIPYAEKLKFSL